MVKVLSMEPFLFVHTTFRVNGGGGGGGFEPMLPLPGALRSPGAVSGSQSRSLSTALLIARAKVSMTANLRNNATYAPHLTVSSFDSNCLRLMAAARHLIGPQPRSQNRHIWCLRQSTSSLLFLRNQILKRSAFKFDKVWIYRIRRPNTAQQSVEYWYQYLVPPYTKIVFLSSFLDILAD